VRRGLCCRVDLVGDTSGEAVLCTRDRTFALRNVETSNTVLLVPPREVSPPTLMLRCMRIVTLGFGSRENGAGTR
jgi:hypothetical protein